jgi:hypothetical protein
MLKASQSDASAHLCMRLPLRCSPHTFTYAPGAYAVDEHFQRVNGPRHAVKTIDKVALHHYVLKSLEVSVCICAHSSRINMPRLSKLSIVTHRVFLTALIGFPTKHSAQYKCAMQEYEAKMNRGDGMGDKKNMAFFQGIDAAATETCTDALQLGPYT